MSFAVLCCLHLFALLVYSITVDGINEVCYKEVDCFSLGPPWNRTLRRENNTFFTPKEVPPPRSPADLNTTVVLYTRRTKKKGRVFYAGGKYHIPRFYKPRMKNYFIIHGYDGNSQVDYLQLLKNSLLDKAMANVFMVDWGTLSGSEDYAQSVSDCRVVGMQLASIIVHLRKQTRRGLNFHLIGFSLGAHICGYAGKEIIRLGWRPVQRITGLDPAGIGFTNLPPIALLDSKDAVFVDAIHTDMYMLGTDEELGDVDFFVNGGHDMPECAQNKTETSTETQLAIMGHVCSHIASVKYLANALSSEDCRYWGVKDLKGPRESGIRKSLQVESFKKACSHAACSSLVDPQYLPARGRVDVNTLQICSDKKNTFLNRYKLRRQRKMRLVRKKYGLSSDQLRN